MNEIPVKVVVAVSAEIGLFLGMGVLVFHSLRIIHSITASNHWRHLRSL